MYKLSQKSLSKLEGVHPDLVKIVKLAITITEIDFGITEGLRSVERQKQLVIEGKSQTMNSRHLTGHAVDVVAYVGGKVTWEWEFYEKINEAMMKAAAFYKIPLVWGGLWTSLKDGPHFELHRAKY